MRSYSKTRCLVCKHEEVRYANVKRCRACHGPIERMAPPDRRELMDKIVARCRMWAVHDPILQELIREWEGM